jgi:hypothetical protein
MVLAGLMAGIAGNAIGYADDGGPRPEHRVAAAGVMPQGGRPLRAATALAGVASIVPPAPPPAPAPPPKKPPGPCPDGMARIGKSCIDRHEAHLVVVDGDGERAHPHYQRPEKGVRYVARSEPGVFPQAYISFYEAEKACQNAGKRMCTWLEWRRACQGSNWQRYPYGNRRKREACNQGKAHLLGQFYGNNRRLWTHENFNSPRLNQEPGYLARTGEYEDCVSEHGVFDMVGNLHEWVSDELGNTLLRTFEKEEVSRKKQPYMLGNGLFLGGFYSTLEEHGPGCYFVTYAHEKRYHDYSTGFRCCADARPDESEIAKGAEDKKQTEKVALKPKKPAPPKQPAPPKKAPTADENPSADEKPTSTAREATSAAEKAPVQ